MEKRPNCYACTYRGNVPGSAHSSCNYPGTETDGFFNFFTAKNLSLIVKLNIRGNHHGVRNGWFMWPVNFDPVWLENCDGFTEKGESSKHEAV